MEKKKIRLPRPKRSEPEYSLWTWLQQNHCLLADTDSWDYPLGSKCQKTFFQWELDEVYKGIHNITGIADDIIISGSTAQDHNQAFIKMLEATQKYNASLNFGKLWLSNDVLTSMTPHWQRKVFIQM